MCNPVSYAATDIDSNTVRLLIKSVVMVENKPLFRKTQLIRVSLRPEDDAFVHGKISEKKAQKLISLTTAYKEIMKIHEVSEYRACATSSMRDASNGNNIVSHVENSTGIKIEIIDRKEEARLILNNTIE